MKKNIACPACNGKGYNTVMTGLRGDYCGVMNEICHECSGTGVNLVDMTNADLIRAMSDEELAELLADDERACPPKHHNCRKYIDKCDGCWLEWLKQPVEEGQS